MTFLTLSLLLHQRIGTCYEMVTEVLQQNETKEGHRIRHHTGPDEKHTEVVQKQDNGKVWVKVFF